VETAGLVVLVIFLLFAALAVVAAVKGARALKRGVERRTLQARRAVEDQKLRARRFAPGPTSELATLRLGLRTSVDSTFEALDGAGLPEAAALLDRLNAHARDLDAELKMLEREPDRSRVAARLPELTDRARRITHSADSLRWAAQDRARHSTADDLADLTREIDMEATALRHWERGYGDAPLGGSPLAGPVLGAAHPDPQPGTASGAVPGPVAGSVPGPVPGAGPGSVPGSASARPARESARESRRRRA
jgi:hypothetical protein